MILIFKEPNFWEIGIKRNKYVWVDSGSIGFKEYLRVRISNQQTERIGMHHAACMQICLFF